MRVLVTGGGGFAGQHLLREILRSEPAAVACTVLGDPPRLPAEHPFAAVHWLSLDLMSNESVRSILCGFEPDVVYHLAGQASVGQSLEEPLETWEVNATGTVRLLAELLESGRRKVRFLLASSAEVYGSVPGERQPIGEAMPRRPLTPYGSSKAAAEIAAIQMGSSGEVEAIVARSFNHIGPGQDQRFVLPNMAMQLAAIRRGEREPVLRAGNLDVERDFLDVRDAVRGYRVLMERGEPGEVYNVSSGRALSLLAVLQRLIDISGTGAKLEIDPDRVRPIDIPLLVGDPSRLGSLGWEATVDLDTTLRDLLAEAESRS